jgi:hypothetical protein
MTQSRRLPPAVVSSIRKEKMLAIRAGQEHRFIGIWAVVVEGRVFVRSWSLKPRSWYRTFLDDPAGAIQVGTRTIPIRAVHTRSESLKDRISDAYLAKYNTPGSLKYARDLGSKRSRDATVELTPAR